jgi:hypothetical protein
MTRLSCCVLVVLSLGAASVRAADPPKDLPPRALVRVGPDRLGAASIEAVAFTPDGKYFVAAEGARLRLFETTTLREPVRFAEGANSIDDITFAADGKTIAASGRNGGTTFWKVADGQKVRELTGFPMRRGAGEGHLSVDLLTTVSCKGNEVCVRDATTGKERKRFQVASTLGGSWLSPNGKVLVSRSTENGGNPTYVFDLDRGRLVATMPTDDNNVGATFAPNSRVIGTVDRRNNLHVWEMASGRDRCVIRPHDDIWYWFEFSNDSRTVATFPCGGAGPIRLHDTMTGKFLGELNGHDAPIRSLGFSPDDRLLVSGAGNGTVFVWDIGDLTLAWRKDVRRLAEPDAVWNDLAAGDGIKARQAMLTLESSGDWAGAFLTERFRQPPQPGPDPARVVQWLKDLDSEEFAVREKATRELEKHVQVLAAVLKRALADPPSPEARRRLQYLVDQIVDDSLQPDALRAVRAVEVLERLNTPEARRVLKRWAEGDAEARLTQEAKAALEWLTRRPTS